LKAIQKIAWKPIIEKHYCSEESSTFKRTSSKYGGIPYLLPEESIPLCESCGTEMTFCFQLEIASLPYAFRQQYFSHINRGDYHSTNLGLLQVFSCMAMLDDSEYIFDHCHDFSVARHIYPVESEEELKYVNTKITKNGNHKEEKFIMSWSQLRDFPKKGELDENFTFNIKPNDTQKIPITTTKTLILENMKECCWDDKLGGYPYWTGDISYPICNQCRARMTNVLFSYTSPDTQFNGILCQCPLHHKEIQIEWDGI